MKYKSLPSTAYSVVFKAKILLLLFLPQNNNNSFWHLISTTHTASSSITTSSKLEQTRHAIENGFGS